MFPPSKNSFKGGPPRRGGNSVSAHENLPGGSECPRISVADSTALNLDRGHHAPGARDEVHLAVTFAPTKEFAFVQSRGIC